MPEMPLVLLKVGRSFLLPESWFMFCLIFWCKDLPAAKLHKKSLTAGGAGICPA